MTWGKLHSSPHRVMAKAPTDQSEQSLIPRMKLGVDKPASRGTDPWSQKFFAHLATDRGASVYTQRNYRQALQEFSHWYREERGTSPAWETMQRDDFRGYLRFLGRQNLGR